MWECLSALWLEMKLSLLVTHCEGAHWSIIGWNVNQSQSSSCRSPVHASMPRSQGRWCDYVCAWRTCWYYQAGCPGRGPELCSSYVGENWDHSLWGTCTQHRHHTSHRLHHRYQPLAPTPSGASEWTQSVSLAWSVTTNYTHTHGQSQLTKKN